jgi:hypothetical protein
MERECRQGTLQGHLGTYFPRIGFANPTYIEITEAMAQGSLATAGAGRKPWCHPHDAGFPDMQKARVKRSWRHSPRAQKKDREAR